MEPVAFEPRATCLRCRRPESVCYCRHLTSIETRTRVVLLQHPRERDVAIGTARMASLCLPQAEIHVGVRWQGTSVLRRALSDPERPAVLLYPGEGAIDVVREPPPGPVTLVVVDGTWWQTKKVVRENPELAKLPRYAFTPKTPSEYRIRREPSDTCVSTIEALVHVLGALEGDPRRFEELLVPFRAMIDAQIACERARPPGPSRHKRKPRPVRRRYVPASLRDRAGDVVHVVGEANAWPYCTAERARYPDELLHWVGYRPRTGEVIDLVLAPENPLAPKAADYVELPPGALAAGLSRAEAFERWRCFARETDVLVFWGHYAPALFAASGGALPEARVDLRRVAREFAHGKVGTLEDFVERLAIAPPEARARGRAGRRLAQVAALAEHMAKYGDVR